MKSSSLSDPKVIAKINQDFVPLALSITDDGFPQGVPALAGWEQVYRDNPELRFGFATTIVVEPAGQFPLATSGNGTLTQYDSCVSYHPDRFLVYLEESRERLQRLREIEGGDLPDGQRTISRDKLQQEIQRSIEEANRLVEQAN